MREPHAPAIVLALMVMQAAPVANPPRVPPELQAIKLELTTAQAKLKIVEFQRNQFVVALLQCQENTPQQGINR